MSLFPSLPYLSTLNIKNIDIILFTNKWYYTPLLQPNPEHYTCSTWFKSWNLNHLLLGPSHNPSVLYTRLVGCVLKPHMYRTRGNCSCSLQHHSYIYSLQPGYGCCKTPRPVEHLNPLKLKICSLLTSGTITAYTCASGSTYTYMSNWGIKPCESIETLFHTPLGSYLSYNQCHAIRIRYLELGLIVHSLYTVDH